MEVFVVGSISHPRLKDVGSTVLAGTRLGRGGAGGRGAFFVGSMLLTRLELY